MSFSTRIAEVSDEETGEVFIVKGKCEICLRNVDATTKGWIYNKGSGLLHTGAWYTNEVTYCGKPCTENTWLHQL